MRTDAVVTSNLLRQAIGVLFCDMCSLPVCRLTAILFLRADSDDQQVPVFSDQLLWNPY